MFTRRGPRLTSQHFYASLALAHWFTASGSGLLSPFLWPFCRDCPAYSERTNGSAQFLTARPFPSALAASRSSR